LGKKYLILLIGYRSAARACIAAAAIIVSLLHPAALCAQIPTCNLDSALRVM
jgi:hypothetical protein